MDFDNGDRYSRESCSVKSMTKMAHQTPSRTSFAVDYDQTPGLSRLTPGRVNRKAAKWYIATVGHKPGIYTNESVARHKVIGCSDGDWKAYISSDEVMTAIGDYQEAVWRSLKGMGHN